MSEMKHTAEEIEQREYLGWIDKRQRRDLVDVMNNLLLVAPGTGIVGVGIDEKDNPKNRDGKTRLVIVHDDGTESHINIEANGNGLILKCFCSYVATGECTGLYRKRKYPWDVPAEDDDEAEALPF